MSQIVLLSGANLSVNCHYFVNIAIVYNDLWSDFRKVWRQWKQKIWCIAPVCISYIGDVLMHSSAFPYQVKICKDEFVKIYGRPSDKHDYSQSTITYQFRTGIVLVRRSKALKTLDKRALLKSAIFPLSTSLLYLLLHHWWITVPALSRHWALFSYLILYKPKLLWVPLSNNHVQLYDLFWNHDVHNIHILYIMPFILIERLYP